MPGITVTPLAAEQIETVYPLVREVVPNLDRASWRRHARRVLGAGRAGVMVAQRDGRAHPCGMFCYHIEQDLDGASVLVAKHLVALDILDPQPVLAVLVAELDALAARFGCVAVRAAVADAAVQVAAVLAHAGHRREGQTLGKPAGNGPRRYRRSARAA